MELLIWIPAACTIFDKSYCFKLFHISKILLTLLDNIK